MSKLLAILALFGAQNQDPVALHFLGFSSRPVPVSLAILAAAVVGLLVGLLVMLPGRITTGRMAGRLQRDIVVRDAEAARITTLTQARRTNCRGSPANVRYTRHPSPDVSRPRGTTAIIRPVCLRCRDDCWDGNYPGITRCLVSEREGYSILQYMHRCQRRGGG